MSIALMTQVWQTQLPAGEKLCLLALADWANDDGSSVFPAQLTLADKCSCSERAVRDNLHRLEERGVLIEVRTPGGQSRRTREYRIDVGSVLALQGQPADAAGRQSVPVANRQLLPVVEGNHHSGHTKVGASPQRAQATAGSSGTTHSPSPKQDLLWDTFDELLGEVGNQIERGKRNRALKAIRQSLNGEGIHEPNMQAVALRMRVQRALDLWGKRGITVTELAVAGNWRLLGDNSQGAADRARALSAQEVYAMTRGMA